jgi:short-subunit dehydrogenase
MEVRVLEVEGRVALITGASSGIGLETARLLSGKGAKLALASRSREKLERLAAELSDAIAVPADMTRMDEVKSMLEQAKDYFGRIDILINNAGQGYDAFVEGIDIPTLRYIFELDLVGPLAAIQLAIPIMRDQGHGAIVNVSSGAALMALPTMGPYAAVKSGLAVLSLTARKELERDGIVVSVVYPYITLTDFEKNTIKHMPPRLEEHDKAPPGDSAEYVAEKILQAVEDGEAEVFAHEWMKSGRS